MSFYGRYINTDVDEKEVEWDMYAALLYFWILLMIILGTKSGKAFLKLFSVILFWHLSRSTLCPNEAGWIGLLVVKDSHIDN